MKFCFVKIFYFKFFFQIICCYFELFKSPTKLYISLHYFFLVWPIIFMLTFLYILWFEILIISYDVKS